MKKIGYLLPFLLILWTSSVEGRVSMVSPEEMVSEAQVIVAGEIKEVSTAAVPELLLEVDTVFRGELGPARLRIPLNHSGLLELEMPEVGTRMLMFFAIDERGQLTPVADLNWAAYLEDDMVSELFYGARFNNWETTDYIIEYNVFILDNTGTKVALPQQEGEKDDDPGRERPGDVASSLFLMFAGVAVLLIVLSTKIKKRKT